MDRRLTCQVCKRSFVALRRDATTCSAKCRKALSRSNAVRHGGRSTLPHGGEPAPVVAAPVTLPAPLESQLADGARPQGWLPLAAVPLPPEPPAPPPKVSVPTRVDEMFGRLADFVQCESPEAAAHWDCTQWRSTDER
jgi:hypothetical protein